MEGGQPIAEAHARPSPGPCLVDGVVVPNRRQGGPVLQRGSGGAARRLGDGALDEAIRSEPVGFGTNGLLLEDGQRDEIVRRADLGGVETLLREHVAVVRNSRRTPLHDRPHAAVLVLLQPLGAPPLAGLDVGQVPTVRARMSAPKLPQAVGPGHHLLYGQRGTVVQLLTVHPLPVPRRR
ncbi:MAG: hypothetical protein R2698_05850 [Microthrixaceae bacterium]